MSSILQKLKSLSSKSPASSPWQSCFQSRSFASWADRGKLKLEIAPFISVRLSTRVTLLHPFRKILLVHHKEVQLHFFILSLFTTWAMDDEQCFRRHLQRAAQCSVASSNNRFGYLCISSWAFPNGAQFHYKKQLWGPLWNKRSLDSKQVLKKAGWLWKGFD